LAKYAVGAFGLPLSQRPHKPLTDLVIALFVALTKVFPSDGVEQV